jgi:hypothetical protein
MIDIFLSPAFLGNNRNYESAVGKSVLKTLKAIFTSLLNVGNIKHYPEIFPAAGYES